MADIIFPNQPVLEVIGESRLPSNVDLTWWKGDAQEFIVELTNDKGAPLALAGHTPLAVLRKTFEDPVIYTFATTVQGGNKVRVYLPSSESSLIASGDYIWNFQLTSPNGDVRTYLAGDVVVYDEVDK